jgi:hypothetical protein
MSRQLQNITGEAAIIQGEDWNYLKFYSIIFPDGDYTLWTPFGQLRTDLEENNGSLLATFEWGETYYDETKDYTHFYPLLSSDVTVDLTPTKYQGNNTLSIKTAYPFDMNISRNNIVLSASYALAQVIGRVSHV